MELNLLVHLNSLKFSNQGILKQVWDPCRKKWVAFSPEEMVRQLFVTYLIQDRGYSVNRIATEKEIQVEKTRKRFDLVLYTSGLKPYILVECKAPEIKLNEPVIAQVVRYNRMLAVEYLIVINGHECRIFSSTPSTWLEQTDFPPLV
ncbi:MAG: type I restriction enzyme HsdR N-terminal domain-containing protein [Saprospiraceae bacterium]|nr:type I restriction enzyme HsdR N-terminal domain-containing protein [Saprospiraceae bacterium]